MLSERLNNATARTKNYEVILQILNDCLQGGVSNFGFCFAGTEEFLTDRRRGLFSYEALATRLADNPFAAKGVVDTKGPVIRLLPLTKEDLFVLLERIGLVQSAGHKEKTLIDHDGLIRFMAFCEKRLGAEHFLTPRDTVKQFIGLLNVLEQNPGRKLDDFLSALPQAGAGEGAAKPSTEGDSLAKFTL